MEPSALHHPWLRYDTEANAAGRCPGCQTSPLHPAQYQSTDAEWQRQMDVTQTDGRPSKELRDKRAALQLAVQRRGECPERHQD